MPRSQEARATRTQGILVDDWGIHRRTTKVLVWHFLLLLFAANTVVQVALSASLWLAAGVLLGFIALYQQGRYDGPRRREP